MLAQVRRARAWGDAGAGGGGERALPGGPHHVAEAGLYVADGLHKEAALSRGHGRFPALLPLPVGATAGRMGGGGRMPRPAMRCRSPEGHPSRSRGQTISCVGLPVTKRAGGGTSQKMDFHQFPKNVGNVMGGGGVALLCWRARCRRRSTAARAVRSASYCCVRPTDPLTDLPRGTSPAPNPSTVFETPAPRKAIKNARNL